VEQLLVNHIELNYSRKKGRFLLIYRDELIEQNVCEFLLTISFLVGQDIEQHLLNTDSSYDQVRIPLTGKGKTITLDLTSFIHFREVYAQQMFSLKLEDMLMRKGIKLA